MFRALPGVAAALALIAAWPAGAAEPPPSMVQEQATAPVDAGSLDLAHRYLLRIHFNELLQRASDQMLPMITRPTLQYANGLSPEQRSALVSAVHETLADFIPRIAEKAAQDVAATYSREELEALVDFYESPIGSKIAAKGVNLEQVSGRAMQSLQPQIVKDLVRRFCARTECPSGFRSAMASAY